METTNSSQLPTSSRLPPAGQDSSETTDFHVGKANYYSSTTLGNDNNSSGTPRRFVLDNDTLRAQPNMKINICQEEIIAPLGFEPEGSVCVLPYFESWYTDFDHVLNSMEGRRVFHQYLLGENHGILLDCWLACQDLKLMNPTESIFYRSVKEFYKRFIQSRDYCLPISFDVKEALAHGFRNQTLTISIFSLIGDNLYSQLDEHYKRFLKSDFFSSYSESVLYKDKQNKVKALNESETRDEFCRLPCCHFSASGVQREKHYDIEKAQGLEAVTNPIKRGACQHEYHRSYRNDVCQNASTQHCTRHSQLALDNHSDMVTVSRDPHSECDRFSAADTFATDFSDRSRSRREHFHTARSHQSSKDGLPSIPNFKPRTQNLSKERMKPMKPEEFARKLTEKLERVLAEREQEERLQSHLLRQREIDLQRDDLACTDSSGKDTLISAPQSSVVLKHEKGNGSFAAQSLCYDRYSVTGTSVSGGSETCWKENHLKYKNGAKELASAVHHALRTELRECRCLQCLSKAYPGVPPSRLRSDQFTYPKSWHGHDGQSEYSCSGISKPCSSSCRYAQCIQENRRVPLPEHHPLTSSNLEQLGDPGLNPPVDHARIWEWMDRNEKYHAEAPPCHSLTESLNQSGPYRRHRAPVIYDTSRPTERVGHHIGSQPIASDPGMPPLPQPDTSTVLEEAKRRLEDTSRGKSSKLRHKTSRQTSHTKSHYPAGFDPTFSEKAQSTTSGNWTASDTVSSVSRQVPSVISSSIPSSASKLWNESKSDLRSEAHTNMSHGSGSSKGRRKGTTITYFLAHEPIPYRTSLPEKEIRLSQFKALLTKKGSFRYFFKTTNEDDGEMVYQEVKDDHEVLPMYQDKIVGKVEKVE